MSYKKSKAASSVTLVIGVLFLIGCVQAVVPVLGFVLLCFLGGAVGFFLLMCVIGVLYAMYVPE